MLNNYRILDTCMTCKFHIEDSDYDEPTSYYCNLDETFKTKYYEKFVYGKQYAELCKWFIAHQVEENGICDNFVVEEGNK